MLRVDTKNKIINIVNNVMTLCKNGISKDDSVLISVLQDAQDAIIAVGERLEKEVENSAEIILMLESLCEKFYLLSTNLEDRLTYYVSMEGLLKDIKHAISEMKTGYQIVFFPYKADMWDALESIWLACKEDPLCDCKVVPIPYYHYDAKTNEWLYRYEIDSLPSYVPVINYEDYSLEEKPDAAFVHNPYDQYNNVTHIHSDYYSYNLKKYVKNLFYVPYYVTSGFIAEDHKVLSVYMNADYLVVQSDSFKEGLRDYSYYDKAKVLGSPKLDKVIQMSSCKDTIPLEWQSILKDKKSLMLNTSLNHFLYDGEAYLQKIVALFDVVSKRKDVVIVWRPHPLLMSTIESMRPHLLDAYLQLQKFFQENQVGILDTTPDVTNTVAIVDGYIGETSSSVVNLFEAAGKPLFILNNYIVETFSKDQMNDCYLVDCERIDGAFSLVSLEHSCMGEVQGSDWENIQIKSKIGNVPKWMRSAGRSVLVCDEIYYAPIWSEEFGVYHTKNYETKIISDLGQKKMLNYRFPISYKDKIFYLPNVTKYIAEYDIKVGRWTEYRDPIKELQVNVNETIYEDVCGYFVSENLIWMTTLYSNRVLCFDMETGKYRIYKIGDVSLRYSAIAVEDDTLYLADAKTGNVFVWDVVLNKNVAMYLMPDSYKTYRNVQGRQYAHLRFWVVGNNIVSMPGTSNGVVKIDLKTGRSEMLAEAFWSEVFESANNYKHEAHGVVCFAKMIDENTLLVQKRRDASLLELNIHTGEYKIHHPKLALGELEKMLEGDDGFEKSYTNGEFARRESRYFSFEGFLDDLVNDRLGDVMARQKEAMQTMAVNLDGTCGEKVHEFMMQVL